MNYTTKHKGFTIIETLVAITILMISIVGPLTIAQKSLNAAIYARDQVTASFLAQDLMEMVKNNRDNYLAVSGNTFSNWVDDYNISNQCTRGNYCQLYIQPGGGYSPNTNGAPSRFSRMVFIDYVTNNNGTPYEAAVTVFVKWKNGTIENEVRIVNHLFSVIL